MGTNGTKLCPYKLIKENNIAERKQEMSRLGLFEAAEEVKCLPPVI